jgi:hypothetical protein
MIFQSQTNTMVNLDVLLNLKLGKAVGNDKISHHMLKHTACTVYKPLEIIFNCSLQTGRLERVEKISFIFVIYNKLTSNLVLQRWYG